MINKVLSSTDEAVADIADGAVLMIGGFGPAGQPAELLDALIRHRPRNLTVISNNAGNGDYGLAALLAAGCVRKIICSFPRQSDSWVFDQLYREKKIELELVPQGNLVARIQAGGSGLGAVYTPTGYGTQLAEGKEVREFEGRHYVLEMPLKADFALIKALRGDRWGNLIFNQTGRNFGPIMAAASNCTLAQVSEVVALGEIDPETVVTPGIFVQRLVEIPTQEIRLSA
ncbi:3-oxoacid CoA-transferase subunit A [Pantoea sp. MBD-2R]|uniref:3-oxoacid CoA-transferase subunit A n=1 Tax=unclassified Pantoea TaxID=2630326 RepID=UPI0011BF6B8F|nr:3-oxoacid CoA-transferase subunit A [Pantoea sp. CCBC3-3-1]